MQIKILASGSTGNAYRISDGKTNLLIECGIPIKKIKVKLNFKLSDITACLITHAHRDHSKAAADVLRSGIPIYSSAGTLHAIGLSGHNVNAIKSLRQFRIGSFTILPFDTIHDAPEPLGFLIVKGKDKLLFATDTAFIRYKFSGLTHIMLECNYQSQILQRNIETGVVDPIFKERLLKAHMGLSQAVAFLKANGLSAVREIYLLHISRRNSNANEMREIVIKETGKPVIVCQ